MLNSPRSPMWSEWKCVSSTPPMFRPSTRHSARRFHEPGPVSTIQKRPPAKTATHALARVGCGIGDAVPQSSTRSASPSKQVGATSQARCRHPLQHEVLDRRNPHPDEHEPRDDGRETHHPPDESTHTPSYTVRVDLASRKLA